jgi:hypothetical protein
LSEALVGQKITKNVRKMKKIAKNVYSRETVPKTGLRGSFQRILSVFFAL